MTFDGDADRAMFADAHGKVVNGDAVMLLAARDMQRRSMLRNKTVVATTGDGMLTALVVLDVVRRSGKPLHELIADLKVFPQVIVNVRVREKKPLDQIASVAETIRDAEAELAESGRVVVRYSGTEALARVMIEAESEEAMRRHADRIAAAIRTELGE